MTFDEVVKILYNNPTNIYICQHLDDKTLDYVMQVLEKLPANDFKELNQNAKFDLLDLPIPYQNLQKSELKSCTFSPEINKQFSNLMDLINKENTNIEYPFLFAGYENEYTGFEQFPNGKKQECVYDWTYIENVIKQSNGKINLSLFHTHPNPLNEQHETLFNKYPDELSKLGVKPNGLNISLADVYAEQYLENLVQKYQKDISCESSILMHDGTLICFSSQNGLVLTNEQTLDQESTIINENQDDREQTL